MNTHMASLVIGLWCCYSDYCESDSKEVDQVVSAMDKGDCSTYACTCSCLNHPLLFDTTDCDGQISFEEFTSYISKLRMNQIE